ncbi:MAG: asparagine synthase (glutamine-hydrolyzing) [Planctomycetota bacterium]|nr:asparagine synthase (glutamine-hydrolyzing) [Planctomycetota bacterium]
MCGIAGILCLPPDSHRGAHAPEIPASWLDALDACIGSRGPDGQGRFQDRTEQGVAIALVHRRLSIIDPAGGEQPMVWRDRERDDGRRVAIVFNGCIYNHRGLRAELASQGRTFHSHHSDTEALLQAYIAWGPSAFERTDSMHAAAIWDSQSSSLTLSRDLFGEKPLYLLRMGGAPAVTPGSMLAFASTPSALVRLHRIVRGEEPALDRAALGRWIRFGHDPIATPWRGVVQLAPGTTLRISLRGEEESPSSLGDILAIARERRAQPGRHATLSEVHGALEAAVASRLDADVPLACLLSGGVDSTLVSALAQRASPGLATACVRMPDEAYDESHVAKRVADALGTRHATIEVGAEPLEDLRALIASLGLPFGDSSLLPTFWACRACKDLGKVLLSGDGGDELFLGYERYQVARTLAKLRGVSGELLRRVVNAPIIGGRLHRAGPKSRASKLLRLAEASSAGYSDLLAIFPQSIAAELLEDVPKDPGGSSSEGSLVLDAREACSARDAELLTHFPGDLLRKTDTASMAAPVELRAPFLSRDLARLVLELPEGMLMPRGERKGLLRAITRSVLPARVQDVVDRPKMGFAVPLGRWFLDSKHPLTTALRDALHSADPFAGVGLRPSVARRLLDEHQQGTRDHSQRLYQLLVLALWRR